MPRSLWQGRIPELSYRFISSSNPPPEILAVGFVFLDEGGEGENMPILSRIEKDNSTVLTAVGGLASIARYRPTGRFQTKSASIG
jgi:hypothetical protein